MALKLLNILFFVVILDLPLAQAQFVCPAPVPAVSIKNKAFFKPSMGLSQPFNYRPGRDSENLLQLNPQFLPKWSAESLPFFCKIEHNWARKRGNIPLKFRLGSVEYVDWLEGKSNWQH
jgi:hypothetical protein